ncbi:MAG: hypothetical protein JWP08_3321 [Bryobacterales bacterium]|nr:hypothetical protein [Bryobacterales bacterium]
MGRSLARVLPFKPPAELLPLLEDIPLVGDETAEDYFKILSAIVVAAQPVDGIDWLHVKAVADQTFEIKREQAIKAGIITLMQKEIVLDLLKMTREAPNALDSHIYRIFAAQNEANRWAVDPAVKQAINAALAAKGHPPSEILAMAYIKGQAQIDAVDKRLASYEGRRIVTLREIERRNEKRSRDVQKASSDIIDAEFSEAAE